MNETASSPPRPPTESLPATSGDIVAAQVANLRKLFPDVFVEGKIDFDKLRTTLGAAADVARDARDAVEVRVIAGQMDQAVKLHHCGRLHRDQR